METTKLSNDEKSLLLKTPILVCLLVAGADHKIEKKELLGFLYHLSKISQEYSSLVSEFYRQVLINIEDKLVQVFEALPSDNSERNVEIGAQLTQLNDIFPKLDPEFAKSYYQSLLDIAEKTAKSSGGIIGVGSISAEEKEVLNLPMVNPVK